MSTETSPRAARVAPLIRQELSALIVAQIQDPRVGFVTITEVDLSPDLKNARVWVSVMGPAEQIASSLRGLRAAMPFLRRALGARLALRQVPTLTFSHDTGLDHADLIDRLLAGGSGPESDGGATAELPAPEVHRDIHFQPPPPAAPRRAAKGRRRRRGRP